ncbi:isomerase [bacterium]|nr:isomerase [bacterium]
MGYIFDPEVLHTISKSVVGLPHDEMFKALIEKIDAHYPNRIVKKTRWVFNTANGAMGTMTILYGSLSEYILIFGTPIGTEGHSGRYFAEVHDFVIEGEMWTYHENETTRNTFLPGDWAILPFRKAKGYCIKENGWMLEYARGVIPAMLPMGIWDNLFSNLDIRSLWFTFWDYGKITIRELLKGKI